MTGAPLAPLPRHPASTPWPGADWPRRDTRAAPALRALVDEMFADENRYGVTYAVVLVHRGVIVAERYGGALPRWEGEPESVAAETPLLSWSMAKSVLHAGVGIAAGRGWLALDAPAPVPAWQSPGDPRRAITLEQLLTMRDGLDFVEDYVDGTSHVIDMLFGEGIDDVAGYAAARPLAHTPGTAFNYSSGTSNIIARVLGDAVRAHAGLDAVAFLRAELFDPIGMTTAVARCDAAGTFVGSSYVHATARDFARFELLYLRDGIWDGMRVLPEGWVDHARRVRSHDPTDGSAYGAHWWVAEDEFGRFSATGYEGQSIDVAPALDLVVVRLGRTDASLAPNLRAWRATVVSEVRR
jgi:CubicO group peptidase (beta-lactamase class C family)